MTTVQAFRSAAHWGAFTALVEDGRLVGVRPFELDPHPNELSEAWPEMVYAPHRVRRPMVRQGWLEGTGGVRGADRFVPVDWDRALALVAGEVKRVRADHGNAALFAGSYGWASAGRLHHARTLLHRFMGAIGGCTGQLTNYSYGAAMVLLPHVLGSDAAVTGPVSDWRTLCAHCDEFIAFGGMAEKNWKVQSGGCGLHPFAEYMDEARASPMRVTNVSPLRSDVAAALEADWLPIRPNTDTAFMLALAYVVEREGATDRAFLGRCCSGFERFLPYLLGATDGVPKTPAWAADITGVPQDRIEALAKRLIGHRVMLTASWSLQRAENGEQPFWMLITLAAMLGQIGLPGGGVAFGYGSINGMGGPAYGTPMPGMAVAAHAGDLKIPVARVADLLLDPGGRLDFNGQVLVYPDIKLVYWAGGNPFHHHQDLFRLREAFQRPETIIVHESWWTGTARHADIVLPATTPLERDDFGGSSRDPFILAMQKAIEPVGEARNDFRVFSDLADRLGAGPAFHEGRDEWAWLQHLYAQARGTLALRGITAPDFDSFWQQGYFRMPEPAAPLTLFQEFRADPDACPLRTPSGRIELFSERIAGFGYAGLPGHAVWRPPGEWLGGASADRFPLHLLSNQPADKLHGQLDGSRISARSKVGGRAELLIHSYDAAARGIADGMVVRLWNERGSCLAGARISADIMPGVVRLPTGSAFDPAGGGPGGDDHLDKHGNPNALTRDVGTSKLSQGCSAQTCLIEVAPFAGPAPPITAFDPPAEMAAL